MDNIENNIKNLEIVSEAARARMLLINDEVTSDRHIANAASTASELLDVAATEASKLLAAATLEASKLLAVAAAKRYIMHWKSTVY